MEIRPASVEDSVAIARVHVASWQEAYRGILPDSFLSNLSVERRAQAWSNTLRQPAVDAYVAVDDSGIVVGFASLEGSRDDEASHDVGEVTTIYVTPEEWGKGYGRALVRAIVDAARARGFGCVTLWVLKENVRARRFYEAFGFVFDGSEKTETGPEDVVFHVVRYRLDMTEIDLSRPGSPSGASAHA